MARDALRGEPDALGLPGQERTPGSPCLTIFNDPATHARVPGAMLWGLLRENRKPILHLAVEAALAPKSRSSRLRRCLAITPGFIQRGAVGWARRRRFEITSSEPGPLALAALWDDKAGSPRFALLTTAPNDFFAPLQSRMPVVMPPSTWATWLSPAPLPPELAQLLSEPCPASWLRLAPVPAHRLYGPPPGVAAELREVAPGADLARSGRRLTQGDLHLHGSRENHHALG